MNYLTRITSMITKRDGRKVDRNTLEYIRKNAIERWQTGERPLDIIRDIGFCDTTIYKWIKLFTDGGMEALSATKAPGAESKLNQTQQQQIKSMIVGKEPVHYGFEYNLWTRQIVSELIKNEFDIELGLTQVGKLLAKLEITPQKPVRKAHEQDPEAVREWKEETFPGILADVQASGAELFFWDEAGYRLDDQVGRSWGKRGQTPEVKGTGKRGRTNSAVAMSVNGAFWFNEFGGNLNSERFCEILDRFMKTRKKKVVVIMDKHPTHTSDVTSEYFSSVAHRLEVHFLPTYSPELNPVEYINHFAKASGPRKQLPHDKIHLSEIVQETLSSLKGGFKKVKKFLKHEELEYIHT